MARTDRLMRLMDALRRLPAPVTAALTNEAITDMNKQVDVEGRDPSVVARDWMVEQGFVTAG